ncbi:MAG: D-lyxose/D-mannose family sugar isomerase [Bacteroidales bacterium]|jgi:D-lyxose ketol-isomerase|nr:D-lyxose/D-mannose family sugar isomerase [Bacteroidales bacterium]
MKRSQINNYIDEALEFFLKNHFYLPAWAEWMPDEWQSKGAEYDEIRNSNLGWDVTDFGGDSFMYKGLTLFTLRNGILNGGRKPYCEKIMYVRENQITPIHFHWHKMEDIINRGGGSLCMQLWKADSDEDLSSEPVKVQVDGVTTLVNNGEILKLEMGQSICYEPYLYHTFWAENGDCLVGEVSTVNDDINDNRFLVKVGRYPAIVEDVPARYMLCNEYKNL